MTSYLSAIATAGRDYIIQIQLFIMKANNNIYTQPPSWIKLHYFVLGKHAFKRLNTKYVINV